MYIGEFWVGVFAGAVATFSLLGAAAAWMKGPKK